MKYLGFTKRILGMDMQKDQTVRVLRLSLQRYLNMVVERFRIHESKLVSTPLAITQSFQLPKLLVLRKR